MVETGVSDRIQFTDDTSTDITDEFGTIALATHRLNQPVEQRGSVGAGPKPQVNLDGVAEPTGTIECSPPNFQILKLFGTFNSAAGSFTVVPDDVLPVHDNFKQQKVSGGGVVDISSAKAGSWSITASENGTMDATFEFMGLDWQVDESATLAKVTPDTNTRQFFDTKVKIGGTVVGSVDTWTADHNRALRAFKGIEDDAAGSKRKPTQWLEEEFNTSFNIVINIEDTRAYREAMDDSSTPLTIQDTRSEKDVEIVIDTTAGEETLKLSDCKVEELESDQRDDGQKRTATIRGVARDWDVAGDI